jgi:threonyl-tRNA synthetase
MFKLEVEKEWHALKPMNCPGHMLIFASRAKSYRDLPLRMAEFGVLHRNEASGALSGLTRVRRFVQDDSHIFLRRDQIHSEVLSLLTFMEHIYGLLNIKFHLTLSTRDPEKFLGDLTLWDFAEASLAKEMCEFCGIPEEFEFPAGTKVKYDGSAAAIKAAKGAVEKGTFKEPKQYWDLNPADAAFYGPKIDIHLSDALNRRFQCATCQLDFVQPERFKLQYVMSEEEKKAHVEAGRPIGFDNNGTYDRPVVVHRAILGSLERCIGILTEHYGGKWPFWMSPRQIVIVPTHKDFLAYATGIRDELIDLNYEADVDDSNDTFQKKIRNGQVDGYNLIVVVGKEELANQTVNVRSGRSSNVVGAMGLPEFREYCRKLVDTHDNTI